MRLSHWFYNNAQGEFCFHTYFVAQQVAGEGSGGAGRGGAGAQQVGGVWREGHEGLRGTPVTSRAPALTSALRSRHPQSANLYVLLLLLLLMSSLFLLPPRKTVLKGCVSCSKPTPFRNLVWNERQRWSRCAPWWWLGRSIFPLHTAAHNLCFSVSKSPPSEIFHREEAAE